MCLLEGVSVKKSKNAFTMIEMIFVIVVLGILASIAIPKLAATRADAEITKGRADISSIRSAIVSERQSRLIKGDSAWISALHGLSGDYFDGVDSNHTLLMYGIKKEDKDGHWKTGASCTGANPNVCTYTFMILGADNVFTYTQADGKFDCVVATAPSCDLLTK